MSITLLAATDNASGAITASPGVTHSLDAVVQARCVNGNGVLKPCRSRLLLSADGGVTYVTAASRQFPMGDGVTSQQTYVLKDYADYRIGRGDYWTSLTALTPQGSAERQFGPPWTHFAVQFSGNEGGTAASVSAVYDSGLASAPALTSAALDGVIGSSTGKVPLRGNSVWAGATTAGGNFIIFTVSGALSVANDIAPWAIVRTAVSFGSVRAAVKTAPVGANLLVSVFTSIDNGATFVDTDIVITILDGNRTAFMPIGLPLQPGTLVRFDCIQVGSGTAGSDLSAVIFGDSAQ